MAAEHKDEEAIFKAAFKLKSPTEQKAYLKKACGSDRELLARIKALLKLINGGQLSAKQLHATVQELSEKCRIYGNGCLKRGRITDGKYYLELPKSVVTQITKD